nr:amidohydrolase family protein [Gemmatimonadota bacterium]
MKRVLLICGAVALSACAANAPPEAVPRVVLSGVTVIDGTGAPPSAIMEVVIEGNRIAAIHRSRRGGYPPGTPVLDLPGRYVIPGLIDTHAHVTVLRWYPDGSGSRRGVYDRGVSARALRLLLAHGVTTVRNPSAPAADGVALREAVRAGEVVGPRILTSGEHLADPRLSEEEIRAEVRRQVALGVDMIKVYGNLPPALVGAVIEEAHSHRIPVVGHLQRTTWTEAARMGIDAITHGSPWSPEY